MIRLSAPVLTQPGIAHGFFGRTGGVSQGLYASLNCGGRDSKDATDNIEENRCRAVESLSPGASLVTLYQVHGKRTVKIEKPWAFEDAPEADAMVTNIPDIALGILAADCAPVLLADASAQVVGAAHAGWKGALAGVLDSAIERMEALGAQRKRIVAAIGPCIGVDAYEGGPDLRERFVASDPAQQRFFRPGSRPHHFQFDLESLVESRLEAARLARVWRASVCTYADEAAFFSYRRATHRGESDYGRQVSAILLCK